MVKSRHILHASIFVAVLLAKMYQKCMHHLLNDHLLHLVHYVRHSCSFFLSRELHKLICTSKVKSTMFVHLPKGLNTSTTNNVSQFHKNLHDNYIAPLNWFKTPNSSQLACNFTANKVAPYIFVCKVMMVIHFVDDLLYILDNIFQN